MTNDGTGDGPGHEDENEDDEDAILDELADAVLLQLGPVMEAYRRAVGRRLGLDPTEMLCVDLLRRCGEVQASRIAERTGLTRGGVTKLVRRLELAGHLERRPEPDGQELVLVLRPHPERDAVLDGLRWRLRHQLVGLAAVPPRGRTRRRTVVAGAVVTLTDLLHGHARLLADDAAFARLREHRRRERAKHPLPWER